MSRGSRKVPNKTLRKTQNSHCANFFRLFFKKNRSKKVNEEQMVLSLVFSEHSTQAIRDFTKSGILFYRL